MKKYGKVAVLMGGWSKESEISLMSGNAVLDSLINSGIDAHAFDPAKQSIFELKTQGFNRVVLMTHGKAGEDGILQGALEYLQIPYTGSGVLASALSMDKQRTKLVWSTYNIPMPKGLYLETADVNQIKANFKLPIIIKPVHEGSTLGLSKVYKWEDLNLALETAFKNDNSILVEEMIVGAEFSITVCDGVVYPAVKIEAPAGDYDYQNKYFTDNTVYICPYPLETSLEQQIKDYAKAGYKAVGARGVARLDFMLDKTNKPYFLEINTIPGMTGHSLSPQAFKAAGISFDQLCLKILDGASLG
ncbi:MAG: D-alanine--D-alanine ligase [Burkholderiales bacterium]|jgi:D-alanine-D-alanine ligase|nr:D-alanine--D-alanine ligase [Burkholderiales bacterium]MCE3269191.1 D-alanine--D-alanine ligase [Burkholderiales bacterium]